MTEREKQLAEAIRHVLNDHDTNEGGDIGEETLAFARAALDFTEPAPESPGGWTPGPWEARNVPDAMQVEVRPVKYESGICDIAACSYDGVPEWEAESVANADLIAEAGTVAHETGRTPRQLQAERDELLKLITSIHCASTYPGSTCGEAKLCPEYEQQAADLIARVTATE